MERAFPSHSLSSLSLHCPPGISRDGSILPSTKSEMYYVLAILSMWHMAWRVYGANLVSVLPSCEILPVACHLDLGSVWRRVAARIFSLTRKSYQHSSCLSSCSQFALQNSVDILTDTRVKHHIPGSFYQPEPLFISS